MLLEQIPLEQMPSGQMPLEQMPQEEIFLEQNSPRTNALLVQIIKTNAKGTLFLDKMVTRKF